ncbi:MAG: transporter substrate-binding domain-containing protein [Ruminococcus sp.]|nr:transporter substrate-binding domain-containing protein [Ruminococcus sp.]
MKKRIASLLLAGAMSVTMLASCGVPDNQVHSIDDLEGKTIGVQIGTTGQIYAEDVKDATVEKYNKGADAVEALKNGKIDAVIIDNEPAKVFVSKNDELKILDDPFVTEDYAMAFNLESTELQGKVNEALKELKADGTIDGIIKHWIGDSADEKSYESPADTKRDNGTLKMATNAEFPPYELKKEGKIVGIDPDIMQAVADKLGMTLEIEDIGFDSLIPELQSKKADVVAAGMTVTEDRKKNVLFSDSYATGVQVIIVRKK